MGSSYVQGGAAHVVFCRSLSYVGLAVIVAGAGEEKKKDVAGEEAKDEAKDVAGEEAKEQGVGPGLRNRLNKDYSSY